MNEVLGISKNDSEEDDEEKKKDEMDIEDDVNDNKENVAEVIKETEKEEESDPGPIAKKKPERLFNFDPIIQKYEAGSSEWTNPANNLNNLEQEEKEFNSVPVTVFTSWGDQHDTTLPENQPHTYSKNENL